MKTFKNINFKKGSETTNVVFCQAQTAPSEHWIEVDADQNNLPQLYMKAGIRYFGYL